MPLLVLIAFLAPPSNGATPWVSKAAGFEAQTFTAKCVGGHDGDTITVYDGQKQTRIRLEGIDTPEKGADFSQRAKQFTSDLAFGKEVRVEGKELDRYGRLVARVFVGEYDVSLGLVEAGLAGHYKQYSDDPALVAAGAPGAVREARSLVATESDPAVGIPCRWRSFIRERSIPGNSKSKVYHAPGCQYYDCSNCTVGLATKEGAASRGFRPHGRCAGAAPEQSASTSSTSSSSSTSAIPSSTTYHGNRKSKVYHAPGWVL